MDHTGHTLGPVTTEGRSQGGGGIEPQLLLLSSAYGANVRVRRAIPAQFRKRATNGNIPSWTRTWMARARGAGEKHAAAENRCCARGWTLQQGVLAAQRGSFMSTSSFHLPVLVTSPVGPALTVGRAVGFLKGLNGWQGVGQLWHDVQN